MSGRLAHKIAVVTGIGAGIGRACALMLAREGAAVVGCDIDPSTAQATVEAARAEQLVLSSIHPCDLTKPDEVANLMQSVGTAHGRIDVLVNAAAIAPHMARVADMIYDQQWVPTLVGEIDIVFLACKAAWPYLEAGGNASIINFASVNAFRGSNNFGMAAHCAGKGAVLALTRQLAIEGAPRIRANTISPGLVRTAATASANATEGPISASILSRIPMKRLGVPEDIGWCAVFLASDESRWITGANVPVDGGVMAN